MADDDPTEQPFRFFDLPQELRDKIYDEMKSEIPVDKTQASLRGLMATVNTLDPTLLLVGRRFKQEAEGQTRKAVTLKLTDSINEFHFGRPHTHEHTTKLVTAVQLELFGGCPYKHKHATGGCNVARGIAKHHEWVKAFCQELPHLAQVHATIDVDWSESGVHDVLPIAEHGQSLMQELWTFVEDTPHIKSVQVYKIYGRRSYEIPEQQEWGRWSAETGWCAPTDPDYMPAVRRQYWKRKGRTVRDG